MPGRTSCCPEMPRISSAEQAQIAKIPGILIRLAEAETRLSSLRTTVDVNKEACDAAHGEMKDGISANQAAILGEKHDRETADTSLQSSIASKAEKTALEEVDSELDAEKVTRENKDTALGGRIDNVEAALSAEIQNRKNADSSIRTDVDATVRFLDSTLRSEISSTRGSLETKIIDAKADVLSKVNEEKTERITEDGVIRQSVIDEKTRAENKESELATLIATKESSIRHDFDEADDELSGRITANAQEIAANKVLFDAAVNDFETSVTQLGKEISDEKTERERVDSENLQAAKDYAKGLLSTALRYQGQVPTLADLNAKTSTATKGDMWNVLDDGAGLAANYAFNGVGWDRLTESIDLSAYAKKTEVETEKTRAEAKESELDGKIATNTAKINSDVGAEMARAKGAEGELLEKIETETSERKAKDTEIKTSISGLAGELENTEHNLNSLIVSTTNDKESAAIGRENAIKSELQKKDLELEASIGTVDAKVDTNKTNIENALAHEVTDRENAVKEVRDQLKVTDITGAERLVGMGEILMKIAQKQDLLQSGINIKTINGKSILGSGNLVVPTNDIFDGEEFSRPTSAYEWYQLVERLVTSLGGMLTPEA